jgi:uncharacterized protein YneF (UPF0154 family)
MKIGWAIISAVLGFFIARSLTKKQVVEEEPDSAIAAERLM